MIVAVLGASPNPERYANKAIRMLRSHGHEVIPVNPGHETIEGLAVAASLAAVSRKVDTVTVYVGPAHLGPLIPEIVALRPRRVIANPGAESTELKARAVEAGIEYLEACTLVLLQTKQF